MSVVAYVISTAYEGHAPERGPIGNLAHDTASFYTGMRRSIIRPTSFMRVGTKENVGPKIQQEAHMNDGPLVVPTSRNTLDWTNCAYASLGAGALVTRAIRIPATQRADRIQNAPTKLPVVARTCAPMIGPRIPAAPQALKTQP